MAAREERRERIRTQRLAQLGSLLAGFAHEVRNPLSTIGLNLQLVLEDFQGGDSPRDRRAGKRLQVVQQEVKRLQAILDEFLSFARRPELKPLPTELNTRLRAVVDFMAPEMAEHGISLRFYPGNGIGRPELDWDHLHAAVVNLLCNAQDACADGDQVMVSTVRDGDFVILRVTDTGEGMTPEVQEKAFTPYFSTKKAGTGLGLATTRRIVEEHDGTLHLSSEVGKGTQFTLRLPMVAADTHDGEGDA